MNSAAATQVRLLSMQARSALARLRLVWPWLAEARLPGPAGLPGTHGVRAHNDDEAPTELEEAYRFREAFRDGVARHQALRSGVVPPGPSPMPLRLAAAAARTGIAGRVRRLAEDLYREHHRADLVFPTFVPGATTIPVPCIDCGGSGLMQSPRWWTPPRPGAVHGSCYMVDPEWVPPDDEDEDGEDIYPPLVRRPCSHCLCGLTTVVVRYDLPDLTIAHASAVLDELLRALDRPALAEQARKELEAAVERAEIAAGAGPSYHRLNARCPACGRRELVAETSSPDRAEWTVHCRSKLCECDGPACGCGRVGVARRRGPFAALVGAAHDLANSLNGDILDRYVIAPAVRGYRLALADLRDFDKKAPKLFRGRHVWIAEEWDCPGGLTDRLGVDLDALIGREHPRLASSRSGQGGWQTVAVVGENLEVFDLEQESS